MLARALTGAGYAITVIESPDIGTVGVGEATIPPIIDLLRFLDINHEDFVRHTQATYKLGIKFLDWRTGSDSYWHPFGTCGAPINRRPFHHAWHKARSAGLDAAVWTTTVCAQRSVMPASSAFPTRRAPGTGRRPALRTAFRRRSGGEVSARLCGTSGRRTP